MEEYSQNFYQTRHLDTKHSAQSILTLVLSKIPKINSAVDFGCGVGTWLAILKEKGAESIQGYDGFWVDQKLLEIPKECFEAVELSKKINLKKKYDLVVSLEVAEHLPETYASEFVSLLTESSDFVLFSAAIPNQTGNHHINEQWPNYWVKKFSEKDFVAYDFIRPKIWHDAQIPFWYKQNILFFVKKQRSSEILVELNDKIMDLVHPDHYNKQVDRTQVGVKGSLILLWQAIKKYFQYN